MSVNAVITINALSLFSIFSGVLGGFDKGPLGRRRLVITDRLSTVWRGLKARIPSDKALTAKNTAHIVLGA